MVLVMAHYLIGFIKKIDNSFVSLRNKSIGEPLLKKLLFNILFPPKNIITKFFKNVKIYELF